MLKFNQPYRFIIGILTFIILASLAPCACADTKPNSAPSSAPSISIVAAENVYGNIASMLGGNYVSVFNVIDSPNQDPHLFNLTPNVARTITKANIIVYNGADYDPWILPLLTNSLPKHTVVINIAAINQITKGANPHLWYLPSAVLQYAKTLTANLGDLDSTHTAYYQQQLTIFMTKYNALENQIATLKNQFANTPVIATEPIFNYMARSIGLEMHGINFQISNMNDVPPSISDIKSFEDDLRQHRVKLFIYNQQVVNPLTKQMLNIAKEVNIPIFGVNETMPTKTDYFQWMNTQLSELTMLLSQQDKSV